MTLYRSFLPLLLIAATLFALPACKSGPPAGTKVQQPFSGKDYLSNNRWYRGTGQGESIKQNIAREKADLSAKDQLAGQVSTNMRSVADQYLGQTDNGLATDVADKFQTLTREVMSTSLADLRKIGEETYQREDKTFTVYVAYEIKKAAMYRAMKKQAATDARVDEVTRKRIEEILDEEIRKAEEEER
jgi:predicted HicB family RNase H-like nuclease